LITELSDHVFGPFCQLDNTVADLGRANDGEICQILWIDAGS